MMILHADECLCSIYTTVPVFHANTPNIMSHTELTELDTIVSRNLSPFRARLPWTEQSGLPALDLALLKQELRLN